MWIVVTPLKNVLYPVVNIVVVKEEEMRLLGLANRKKNWESDMAQWCLEVKRQ